MNPSVSLNYLHNTSTLFRYYKSLGDKTLALADDSFINIRASEESNTIVHIVKHLSGNMLSRFTDFLTTDGEKEWRNRDDEFEGEVNTKQELTALWEKGWNVVLEAIDGLKEEDLMQTVYIRGEAHTVLEALNRQLAHYSYHVGQLVLLCKIYAPNWKALTIARKQSKQFNEKMMGGPEKLSS